MAAGADGQREKGLRGGNAARSALRGLHAAGVRMAIVTAQSPSLQTVRTLSGELHALGIAELFGVPADGAREAVLDALAENGATTPRSCPSASRGSCCCCCSRATAPPPISRASP